MNGLLFIYIISSMILSISLFLVTFSYDKYYGCPKQIYRNSDASWLGVFLLFIFLFISMPLYYILWGTYYLYDKIKMRVSEK